MTNTTELRKIKPSKKLREAILNVVGSFQKTSVCIDHVFSIGREEGFTDVKIGNMVRKEMLAAGYNLRTIRRALPLTSKQIQKTRKDYYDEDKMSSSAHKNEVHAQSAQKSDNNPYQESVWKELVTEQRSNQPSAEQLQQSVQGIEDNAIFRSARISTLPEDSELLKFEIPIPREIFWRYVEDHLGEDHDNPFWINGTMNQETGRILSVTMGRSDIPQI
ncbi:MAG: hypothetical protein ACRD8W_05025 [Nitrososphaeraceae archaeon]